MKENKDENIENKEEILKEFISKLISESKDIDPEFAEIINKNYKDLLW